MGLAERALTDGGVVSLGKLLVFVTFTSATLVIAAMGVLMATYQNAQAIDGHTQLIQQNTRNNNANTAQIQMLAIQVESLSAYGESTQDRVDRLERQLDGQ